MSAPRTAPIPAPQKLAKRWRSSCTNFFRPEISTYIPQTLLNYGRNPGFTTVNSSTSFRSQYRIAGASEPSTKNLQLSLFVAEYDAAVRRNVSVDRVSIDKRICKSPRARPEIGILYFLYVIPRFAKRRNALCLVNSPFTRIVRRQRQIQVAIVALQQHLQMSNPGVDILLRVEQVVRSVSLCRRGNQLHQSAGAFARIRPRVPVRFRFDHRANQCRVHAMPFRSFSYEFFCSVPVNAHGRTVASRKRRFARQVDSCARPCSAKLQRRRRFGIDEKLPSCRFRDFRDLGAGARREKSRAKNQRSQKKPCRDWRAFHHCASGKANTIFCNQIQSVQFSTSPGRGQCLFRTRSPCQTVYPWGRTPGEWCVLRSRAGREVGSVRAALDTTRLGSRAWGAPAGRLLALSPPRQGRTD